MMERRLGSMVGAGRYGFPSQEFQSGNSIVNPHDEIPTFETWDHLTCFSLGRSRMADAPADRKLAAIPHAEDDSHFGTIPT